MSQQESIVRVSEGEVTEGEHPLETAWTFWYDKRSTDRQESDAYAEGLKQLGTFATVEDFYRHYSHMQRPSDLPYGVNVHCFRKGYKPMWEEFPDGGCWILRVKKKASRNYLNYMWECLLMACIGEDFEIPDVVGCVVSTRFKDDILSVWNLQNSNHQARFKIGEKLKKILDLDENTLIQYKDHMSSMKDFSTYRNAKNYMFSSPGQGPASPPPEDKDAEHPEI
jgi:translation initiation factor 4E